MRGDTRVEVDVVPELDRWILRAVIDNHLDTATVRGVEVFRKVVINVIGCANRSEQRLVLVGGRLAYVDTRSGRQIDRLLIEIQIAAREGVVKVVVAHHL